MRSKGIFLSILTLIISLTVYDIEARVSSSQKLEKPLQKDPPRREGGPGGARPSPQVSRAARTPSMSRAEISRPSISRQLPAQRPAVVESRAPSTATREQITQYLKKSKERQNVGQRPVQRQQVFQGKANQQAVNNVRGQIKRNRPGMNNWFSNSFFESHRYKPSYYNRRGQWWRATQWNNINSWLGWGWAYPVYYTDEGYAEPYISYQAPVEEGYETPQPDEWLPLGVFAAGATAEQASYSSMFVQLAIDKEGDIAGTYYNAVTDQTHPLAGLVDRGTQQAVWKVSDNPNSPLMSTGIYNLTQDEVPVQVNFPDGSQQTWILVRLQNP